jgi:hypothetical protein
MTTQRLLAAMRAGGNDAGRQWASVETRADGVPMSLFDRVVVALPCGTAGGQDTRRYDSVMCIFDELFLERGGRQEKQKANPLYTAPGADDFRKSGLDGPRPILNLARDALEHRLQFC